ncbi:glutathione S-transferase family protein [Teredinibacter haidensis]|uniref:glutathione S-transferase family protein n=1 Tax=Teredinibacter haidensis TaxID=2731755 RepID=UPI000948FD9A|nr:glutathione S-transferase family protein [Teredinibacter haidensis]
MKLVIGNQNYSSWSLRPWLLLRHFDIDFDEIKISLAPANLREILGEFSPSCKVPVLIDGDIHVWDTLAICEYVNDRYLNGKAWPEGVEERALARSVVCEMHSGFSALRSELPMNCRAFRKVILSDEAVRDIARVDQLWSQADSVDAKNRGSWLFGRFGVADCFYAPVAFRFKVYGIELSENARAYSELLLNHPAMQDWLTAARAETEILQEEEVGEELI